MKTRIKRISVIGVLVVLLAGGLGFGIFKMVAPLPIFADSQATQTTIQTDNNQAITSDTEIKNEDLNNQAADADNVQDESVNAQEDSGKANEAAEANESANEKEQDENLPGGGHQDQDNVDVDHQFEGVE